MANVPLTPELLDLIAERFKALAEPAAVRNPSPENRYPSGRSLVISGIAASAARCCWSSSWSWPAAGAIQASARQAIVSGTSLAPQSRSSGSSPESRIISLSGSSI